MEVFVYQNKTGHITTCPFFHDFTDFEWFKGTLYEKLVKSNAKISSWRVTGLSCEMKNWKTTKFVAKIVKTAKKLKNY